MRSLVGLRILLCTFILCSALAAQAATRWDESVDGDLSSDGLAPTPLLMGAGSNLVLGLVGNSGLGIDRDYFSFLVPTGSTLAAIKLLSNTAVSGGASFIAIEPGAQLDVSPSGAGVERLIGFAHYGNDQIGTNILPDMAISFSGALPSGVYSVWVQDTGGPATYGLDFVISSAVPEPGSLLMLACGLAMVAGVTRRRTSRGTR